MNRLLDFYFNLFVENVQNVSAVWDRFCKVRDIKLSQRSDFPHETPPLDKAVEIANVIRRCDLPQAAYTDLVNTLFSTGNEALAMLMQIEPTEVADGALAWSVVVNELWDGLMLCDVNEIISALLTFRLDLLKKDMAMEIRKSAKGSEVKMAMLLVALSKSGVLEPLRKSFLLLETHDAKYSCFSAKCLTMSLADLEWLNLHRNAFILQLRNPELFVSRLGRFLVFSKRDIDRILRITNEEVRTKCILDTLERKSTAATMDVLIDVLEKTGNKDLSLMMNFQPSDLQITVNEFNLLEKNWTEIKETVKFEDMLGFVQNLSVSYRLKLLYSAGTDEDKMEELLQLLPISKQSIYDSFFAHLSLKYRKLFQESFPMGNRERRILLETQDFVALNMEHGDEIANVLYSTGILTPVEKSCLDCIPEGVKKSLRIVDFLKKKSIGTVSKFRSILWKHKNRDCAEILAINFAESKFVWKCADWTWLKQNWLLLTRTISARHLMEALSKLNVLTEVQAKWVQSSKHNKQQMRKILRILPSKKNGLEALQMVIRTTGIYEHLRTHCSRIDPMDLAKIETGLNFLVHNTNDLPQVLHLLVRGETISAQEADFLECHENPEEELYLLLMGKKQGSVQELIQVLKSTSNFEAAVVLEMDLGLIQMSLAEWADFLEIWPEFAANSYQDVKQDLMTWGVLSHADDELLMKDIETNEGRMLMLLHNLPYRPGSLSAIVRALCD